MLLISVLTDQAFFLHLEGGVDFLITADCIHLVLLAWHINHACEFSVRNFEILILLSCEFISRLLIAQSCVVVEIPKENSAIFGTGGKS